MRPRDYVREFAECVRALPGFMGERLRALAEEMELAKAERSMTGGYVGSVPRDAGEPFILTRGVAVLPQAMIDKYGDALRAMHPDTDLVALEDIEDGDAR